MSQEKLAAAVGITQGAISQMESGLISPSDEVSKKLAGELSYHPSVFSAEGRYQQLPVTFFRKQARVSAKDVGAIRARVNLYRLQIEVLLRSYDLGEPRLAIADLTSDGLTPAEAAQRLRIYWNVPPGPIPDLTGLLESHNVLVVPMEFGTSSVDGLSIYEPNDILPPTIFVNSGIPADRWRFTLAHELAHICLHHHLPIPPPAGDLEPEAHAFAVEFLTPESEIRGQLNRIDMRRLAQLKKHWRVSMQYLIRLGSDMGKDLPKREERMFWAQYRRKEPVEIEPEKAHLLRKMIDYHMEELGYDTRSLSKALHMMPEEFRVGFGLSPARLRLA